MEVIKLTYPHDLKKETIPPSVAAIGFFDGIHQGHEKVIRTAVMKAKNTHQLSAVITFHPHPSVVLNKAKDIKYITPMTEKIAQLRKLQVDIVYIVQFNEILSQLSPAAFVEHFVIRLHISHLIAGFDFTFGYKGAGNMQNIHQFANGAFTTEVIDKVESEHEKISSTSIRKLLKKGDISQVNELLGRPFSTTGKVVTGDKRGRTIGFPTANLAVDPYSLLPKQGVYAVKVDINGDDYKGALNLGVVPTFKKGVVEPSLEVYILDFNDNIYGKEVTVYWHKFIRSEKKFADIDTLVAQLTDDEKTIRKYFEKR